MSNSGLFCLITTLDHVLSCVASIGVNAQNRGCNIHEQHLFRYQILAYVPMMLGLLNPNRET